MAAPAISKDKKIRRMIRLRFPGRLVDPLSERQPGFLPRS
jgi:hypothetical protein